MPETRKTTARLSPDRVPSPASGASRTGAALQHDSFDALDAGQQRYARLLANYVIALHAVEKAAAALEEADSDGYVSGYIHADDGWDHSSQEDREMWDDWLRGALAVGRVAEQERSMLDTDLHPGTLWLVTEARQDDDDDEDDGDADDPDPEPEPEPDVPYLMTLGAR
jgi:hypothetical protein